MNRARNRGGRGHPGSARGSPATPQQAAGTVPPASRVVPGAAVAVVLKEDQPTGRETRGVVQDVLGRGNHPRGIKVRLRSGQVGRVQRMDGEGGGGATTGSAASAGSAAAVAGIGARATVVAPPRYTDVRNDDFLEGPPPRSLADFVPDFGSPGTAQGGVSSEAAVKCPFCEDFEGDEVAVTHHIDQKHLT